MSNATLKAGLIGAAVAVVLSLLSLVPCLGCIASVLALVLYVGVGVLAAYWMEPPRDPGAAAGAGAIAGLIAALAGGITGIIATTIRFSVTGGQAAIMRQLPPEILRQLREAGVPPRMFASTGAILGTSTVCCLFGLALAAGLGAAGGAIMAAIESE